MSAFPLFNFQGPFCSLQHRRRFDSLISISCLVLLCQHLFYLLLFLSVPHLSDLIILSCHIHYVNFFFPSSPLFRAHSLERLDYLITGLKPILFIISYLIMLYSHSPYFDTILSIVPIDTPGFVDVKT